MDALFETDNYYISVAESPFVVMEGKSPSMYVILNKGTGVCEAEHRILGTAIEWCKHIQHLLDESHGPTKAGIMDSIPTAGPPSLVQ